MQTPEIPGFDPTWRDDIFEVQALEIPLALPDPTPRRHSIWIDQRPRHGETIFGHDHFYQPYRWVTSVLKPSDMTQYYRLKDQQGNILPADSPAMSVIFPPKAWISDAGEERCTMFAAAKLAKGHVLLGGLGLGIYPQFALALNRPVESFTIVEQEPEIIEFMTRAWLDTQPAQAAKVTVVEGTIEEYLTNTERTFDTIFLDTWEDADPRFLAHINYLVGLAARRCATDGTIRCWGYARTIETFIEQITTLPPDFPWHKYHLDPVLQAFIDWLTAQEGEVSEATMTQMARHYALTVQQSLATYDRRRCFTAFGTSISDAYRNMALSQKGSPKQ